LARAGRVDKLTLAALEATLRGPRTPTWLALHADPTVLRRRAERMRDALQARGDGFPVETVQSVAVVGGGGAPGLELSSWSLVVPENLARDLRCGDPAVVGRVERGRLLLDLRCIPAERDAELLAAILAVDRRG
jgi:L-seryl-tRNA(Ser) seleniumtransferase